MIQAICPFSTVKSTSCTAINPSKDLETFSTRSSIGVPSSRARGGVQGSAVLLPEGRSDLRLPEVVMDEYGPQHDDHQARQGRMRRGVQRAWRQGGEEANEAP